MKLSSGNYRQYVNLILMGSGSLVRFVIHNKYNLIAQMLLISTQLIKMETSHEHTICAYTQSFELECHIFFNEKYL